MRPMKVTCHLVDGRVNSNDGLFHLDSILAWAWTLENHPDALFNGSIARDGFIQEVLPLEFRGDHWAASSGFYVQYSQSIEYWHRRVDDGLMADYADFRGKRGKINSSSGEMKAYRMPQVVRIVGPIEFWAVGDMDEVERLLRNVTNIGKKPAMGWGAVREWTVEPWKEDWSEMGPYGVMRPMPFSGSLPSGGPYQVRPYRLRPPYWMADDRQICVMPNAGRKPDAEDAVTVAV